MKSLEVLGIANNLLSVNAVLKLLVNLVKSTKLFIGGMREVMKRSLEKK